MNLVIDVGNSFVKLAVFDRNDMVFNERIKPNQLNESVLALNRSYHIAGAIVSSVGQQGSEDIEHLSRNFKLLILDSETRVPFINKYDTPLTLGLDRVCLVSASVAQYPNNNTLIIDAGTCITYDFVTAKNEYLGGAISPGIRMRYTSLHTLTANLPLLDTEIPKSIVGSGTNESIHSGVVNGVLNEIDGVIEEYQQKYPDLTVILTGGDANFLSKQLKSSIFANSNFLLEGLNYILQFNSI